jgi:serine/threonine-protein kinase HipA
VSTIDAELLRSTVLADVRKAGALAATLRRRADGTEFRYVDEYVEAAGPPVATTLPLDAESVLTVPGSVPPFFAGLLPEGRRLQSLRRAVKTSADDEFTMLLAVGRDTVGDVQVVPSGDDREAPTPLAQVDRAWSEISFTEVLGDAGVVDPVALAGVQDKTSARMISVPVDQRGVRYILKVDPPELPHLVENEAYFLRRARESGLRTADATVVHDRDGRPGLAVRRFDRVPGPDGSTRQLAVEDGCQVLGRWPADKYNVTAEEVVRALAGRCEAGSVALLDLVRQLYFAWLTGNGDVHAKNLSILSTADGEWRVSPAYDLPSTVPYRDAKMALSMVGRYDGFSRRLLLEFATGVGLPERAAGRVLDGLLDRLGDLEDELRSDVLPFAGNVRAQLVKVVRNRRRTAES